MKLPPHTYINTHAYDTYVRVFILLFVCLQVGLSGSVPLFRLPFWHPRRCGCAAAKNETQQYSQNVLLPKSCKAGRSAVALQAAVARTECLFLLCQYFGMRCALLKLYMYICILVQPYHIFMYLPQGRNQIIKATRLIKKLESKRFQVKREVITVFPKSQILNISMFRKNFVGKIVNSVIWLLPSILCL